MVPDPVQMVGLQLADPTREDRYNPNAEVQEEPVSFVEVVSEDEVGDEVDIVVDERGRFVKLRISDKTLALLYDVMLQMEISQSSEHETLRLWIRDYSASNRNSKYWQAGVVFAFALGGGAVGIGGGFAPGGIGKALTAASTMLGQGGNVATPFFQAHQEYEKLAEELVKGDDHRTTNWEERFYKTVKELQQAEAEARRHLLTSATGQG